MNTEAPDKSKVKKFIPAAVPIKRHLGIGQIVGLGLLVTNLIFGLIYLDDLLQGQENALQQNETLKKSIALKKRAIDDLNDEIKFIKENSATYELIVKHRPLKPRNYNDVKKALSRIRNDNYISKATLQKEPKYARLRGSHTIETEIINLELRSFLDSDIFNFAHDAATSIDAILFLDSFHMKRISNITNKHVADIRDGLNQIEYKGLVQGKMKFVFRNAVAANKSLFPNGSNSTTKRNHKKRRR
ncbi:MAG: hypothetical protein GY804_05750 [Alphaproteobacteria bacterium]|nr:hypothetical protein [Alphaproteobacteria bacterium]